MTDVLSYAGYEVSEAATGERALLQLQVAPAHLVVLDIQMPGIDGVTVARELRADPRFDAMPILAVTALDSPEDVVEVLSAGCDAYLSKPVDIEVVIQLVSDLLANGRSSAARM